jgi:hypothetical protein
LDPAHAGAAMYAALLAQPVDLDGGAPCPAPLMAVAAAVLEVHSHGRGHRMGNTGEQSDGGQPLHAHASTPALPVAGGVCLGWQACPHHTLGTTSLVGVRERVRVRVGLR